MAASLLIACVPVAAFAAASSHAQAKTSTCTRASMTVMVNRVLKSMAAHDPYTLPLSLTYEATENSHPAALGTMELWRTVTRTPKPDFLAIDPVAGQAFFLTQINEGGDLSVMWGRIKVVDQKITQLELYVNRSKGDHGFSFSAKNLPANVRSWMHPPANRVRASRAKLEQLARASFNSSDHMKVEVDPTCQFLEAGSHVIDPGLGPGFGTPEPPSRNMKSAGKAKYKPLGCVFPPYRPNDLKARTIVIDQKLGIVVVAGMVPGRVFPYPFFGHMISAFIPDDMTQAQKTQEKWYNIMLKKAKAPLLKPAAATGVTMQVLQFYNGKLQGSQINVHLERPGIKSIWVK